ncbi:MAG: hypothetical protein ACOC9Q_00920 [bacterium]
MTVGFTQQSRLFDAFMAREDLFDRLLAHDCGFAKFHRVLTDEAIARRLTIADAAAVLGIAADDLVALAEGRDPESLRIVPAPADREEALAPGTPVVVVDTRPVFEEGREPLVALLDAAEALTPDESLEVLAPLSSGAVTAAAGVAIPRVLRTADERRVEGHLCEVGRSLTVLSERIEARRARSPGDR